MDNSGARAKLKCLKKEDMTPEESVSLNRESCLHVCVYIVSTIPRHDSPILPVDCLLFLGLSRSRTSPMPIVRRISDRITIANGIILVFY